MVECLKNDLERLEQHQCRDGAGLGVSMAKGHKSLTLEQQHYVLQGSNTRVADWWLGLRS